MGQIPPRPRSQGDHRVIQISEIYQKEIGGVFVRRVFEISSGPYSSHAEAHRYRQDAWRCVENELDEKSRWDREYEEQTGDKVESDDEAG